MDRRRIAPAVRTWALAAFAAAALLAAAPAAWPQNQNETLRLATEGGQPPFNQRDGDTPSGFDVELGNAICQRLGRTCSWTLEEWDRLLPGLADNQYDVVISSIPITTERERVAAFSRPYYRVPQAFAVRRDDRLAATDAQALANRTIGVEAGTLQAQWLAENLEGDGIRVHRYGRLEEAGLDLAAGRIDVLFGDKLQIDHWLASDEGACCRFVGADVQDPATFGPGPGMAFRFDDEDLRQAFERAVDALVADGTFARIAANHVRFDITPRRSR